MKKLLFLLLLVSMEVNAQFKPKIAIDYFPNNKVRYVNTTTVITIDNGDFRARIGGEYKYKLATAYFDQHVFMNNRGIRFRPIQAYWYVGIKLNITSSITLKAEHLCIHPILQNGSFLGQIKEYGGYNMISLSYNYD